MTAIYITLIICSTVALISVMSTINKVIERKQIMKDLDKFTKAFDDKYSKKSRIDWDKYEKKEKKEDDLPKFGGF